MRHYYRPENVASTSRLLSLPPELKSSRRFEGDTSPNESRLVEKFGAINALTLEHHQRDSFCGRDVFEGIAVDHQ